MIEYVVMKRKNSKVTALIPAVNEEKNIAKIVSDCLKIKKYDVSVIVILDSKTKDNTKKNAEQAGATVINIGRGLGKGRAISKSIPFIKDDYVVQIDADYQFLPKEIPLLIDPLFEGYDVTLGTRYQKGASVEKGSVSLLKLLGSYFLSFSASVAARKRITDVMAGFKGFRREILVDLNPKVQHFGYEAELAIRAARRKYKIINIPISYKKRLEGTSNVSSVKHGFLVLESIIKTGNEKV